MQPIVPIAAKVSGRKPPKRVRNVAARLAEGLPPERISFLIEIRERVASGFYNTEPVIEDLCHSFTKAVDALV
ncbi:MAG: hypothetical protein LBC59_03775 [Chitinispirillales bacterium]|jgi:hypothetical protein|nr:hypothetical protein [Chitinispirillales bacterium]